MNGISNVGTMAGGYDSSLALMSNLNGIVASNGYSNYGGYGGFNTGFMGGYGMGGNITDVEGTKQNIKNQYDVYATQQSYQDRQSTEVMSQSERANNIAMMLRSGRERDAIDQFNVLTAELKSTPQYADYSDSQIKAIAGKVYQGATGQDLRTDIVNNAPSSFSKGLIEGIPIIGTFFTDNTSREDIISKVTDTPVRASDQAAKTIGASLSGAAGGAALAAIGTSVAGGIAAGAISGCGVFSPVTAVIGGVVGAAVGIAKSFWPKD